MVLFRMHLHVHQDDPTSYTTFLVGCRFASIGLSARIGTLQGLPFWRASDSYEMHMPFTSKLIIPRIVSHLLLDACATSALPWLRYCPRSRQGYIYECHFEELARGRHKTLCQNAVMQA